MVLSLFMISVVQLAEASLLRNKAVQVISSQVVYGLVITLIYAAIAIGRVPRLRMNRATIALSGAALLILIGAITQEVAFAAIDLGTLVLLFSMMILNANLRLAGFFDAVADRTLSLARSPRALLALVMGAAGLLSALFLNDTICLLFTPLVVDLTLRAHRNPIPYLIGLACASNIGSTATITGNPQNLIIGQASGLGYLEFAAALTPVAILGLVAAWSVLVLLYPAEFHVPFEPPPRIVPRIYSPLLWRTLMIVAALLIAFLAGAPVASASLITASALLISRVKPEKLLAVDWNLLVFFAGLFMITGAIEATGLSEILFDLLQPVIDGGIGPLSLAAAALSNIVSNVPAVLLFRPIVPALADPDTAWLTLAMASTLAGNLTLLGSIANLIVAEIAGQRGIVISFMEYLRAGVPITLITLAIGILWITLVR